MKNTNYYEIYDHNTFEELTVSKEELISTVLRLNEYETEQNVSIILNRFYENSLYGCMNFGGVHITCLSRTNKK